MPRLSGPPWIWKVVYDDGDVQVTHNVLGPWTGTASGAKPRRSSQPRGVGG